MLADDSGSDLVSQIERLTALRKEGLISDAHFEAALTKLLAPSQSTEQPLAPSPTATQCPSCGTANSPDVRFCAACGDTLSAPCPLCKAMNALSTCYCTSCGSDIHNIHPGFDLESADRWRGMWDVVRWWQDPFSEHGGDTATRLFHEAGLPPESDDSQEYWIFCCRLSHGEWQVRQVTVNATTFAPSMRGGSGCYLIATRTRFVILDLPGQSLHHLPFQFVTSATAQRNEAVFAFADGSALSLAFTTIGPSTLDRARRAYWRSQDTLTHYLMDRKISMREDDVAAFRELTAGFVADVAAIGASAAPAAHPDSTVTTVTLWSDEAHRPSALSSPSPGGVVGWCTSCGAQTKRVTTRCPSCGRRSMALL